MFVTATIFVDRARPPSPSRRCATHVELSVGAHGRRRRALRRIGTDRDGTPPQSHRAGNRVDGRGARTRCSWRSLVSTAACTSRPTWRAACCSACAPARVAARRAYRSGGRGRKRPALRERPVTTVAVVAHPGKSLGGGLGELRDELARAGVADPIWYEVPKSKKAPKRARAGARRRRRPRVRLGRRRHGAALHRRARRLRRRRSRSSRPGPRTCSRRTSGSRRTSPRRSRIGLHGARRRSTSAVINGEHFAVMAGAGFDALMIRDADGALKDRVGRLAYVFTGAKNLRGARVSHARSASTATSGSTARRAACSSATSASSSAASTAFADARPDDGLLEIGVVTAEGVVAVDAHAGAHRARATPSSSPFVHTTRGEAYRRPLREADRRTSSTAATARRRSA